MPKLWGSSLQGTETALESDAEADVRRQNTAYGHLDSEPVHDTCPKLPSATGRNRVLAARSAGEAGAEDGQTKGGKGWLMLKKDIAQYALGTFTGMQ